MEKEEKKTKKENAAPETPVKKPSGKSSSKKRRRRAAKIGFVVTLSVLLILVVGAAIAAVVMGHRLNTSDKIMPNVYVGEVFVGDLTKEEAAQKLLDSGWDERHGGTLTVRLPAEVEFELDFYEAGVSFTAAQMADFAYAYGHDGNDMDALRTYIDGMSATVDVIDQELVVNEDYIREKAEDGAARFEVRTAFGDYRAGPPRAASPRQRAQLQLRPRGRRHARLWPALRAAAHRARRRLLRSRDRQRRPRGGGLHL